MAGTDEAEEEQQILEHGPKIMPCNAYSCRGQLLPRYVEEERGALGNGRCGEPAFARGAIRETVAAPVVC
jgi:hypothetical protein